MKRYYYVALTMSTNTLVECGTYALAFWYGARLVANGNIVNAGSVFTVRSLRSASCTGTH